MKYSAYHIPKSLVLTNETEARYLNLLWLGFIIYSVGYVFSKPTSQYDPVFHSIQLVGVAIFIPATIKTIGTYIHLNYLKVLFSLFILWQLFIVLRGYPRNFVEFKSYLFDAFYGSLIYFAPLFLLLRINISFLRSLFKVVVILNVVYVFINLIFIKLLIGPEHTSLDNLGIVEQFSKTLGVSNFFLLLTLYYHSNKRKALIIFVTLLMSFFALYNARRGLMFISASMVFFAVVLHFIYSNKKWLYIVLSMLIISILTIKIIAVLGEPNNVLFGYLKERIDEDTRSIVEFAFFNDLTVKDWIIGKGMRGEYYCPYIDEMDISNYRYVIETDYLQLILRGGLINCLLYFLIMAPAIYLGFFRSKNLLTKAAATWILLWIIYLYPTGVTTFTLHYIIVWISIGICYTEKLRNIPEPLMMNLLNPKMRPVIKNIPDNF